MKENEMDNGNAKYLNMPDSGAMQDFTQGCPNGECNSPMTAGEVLPENDKNINNDFTDLETPEIFLGDRRRAKSLPAYPEQATLLEGISQRCRKKVKFADALGLSLASVKHFSATEDPQIPFKVLSRLQSFPPKQDSDFMSSVYTGRLVPTFKMPVECSDFDTRVKKHRVSLERVTGTVSGVRGFIRVSPSGCKKQVGVRYTFNKWRSFVDAQATPSTETDNSATCEQFVFTVYTPLFLDSFVDFAVYCKTERAEFWDNNDGQNYTLNYLSTSNYETAAFQAT